MFKGFSPSLDIDVTSYCRVREIDGKTHVYAINEIIVDKDSLEQRIKIMTILNGITMREFSERIGISQANLVSKCRTGKLSFSERSQYAEALRGKLVLKFVFNDGSEFTGKTAKDLIECASAHANISQAELAQQLGKSRQNWHSKIGIGKFSDAELKDVAAKLGCEYVNYFEMPDGTRI